MTLISRFVALILSFSLCSCLCSCMIQGTITIPSLCFDTTLVINPLDSNVATNRLHAAADVWNDALGRQIILVTPIFESDIDVMEVPEIDQERYPGAGGLSWNYWDDVTGEFESCSVHMLRGSWGTSLLAHELGHCMGLSHDSVDEFPKSVMNRPVVWNAQVEQHHVNHLAKCPLTKMPL